MVRCDRIIGNLTHPPYKSKSAGVTDTVEKEVRRCCHQGRVFSPLLEKLSSKM